VQPTIEAIALIVEKTESVDLRALVIRDRDDWQLSHATLIVGGDAAPPERVWRYSPAIFIERRVPGPLAAALMRGEPQEIAGLKVQVPSTHPGGRLKHLEAP
jgi:hypothetical protein